MNQKILLGWAVSATALALVFLGYALGKTSVPDTRAGGPALHSAGGGNTDGAAADEPAVDPYVVPEALAGLPTEWHSVVDGQATRGYAILFDPQRREAIVEKCHHRGYVDQRNGKIVEPGWEFCTSVLWSTLARIDEKSATAIHRGQPVEIEFELSLQNGAPRLSLSYEGHDMVLQPGRKNDFWQALENTPQMLRQKDKFVKTMVAREQAQRRVAQQTGGAPDTDVPTYSLPGNDVDRDQQDASEAVRQTSGQ